MLKKFQKKHLVFTGLVLLLCVTGVANYTINQKAGSKQPVALKGEQQEEQKAEEGAEVAADANYFVTFRAERQGTREQEVAYLDTIIADAKTDAETLKDAQEQKMAIVAAMEKEVSVEGLVKAKGFSECVATIKAGSVNIVVENTEPLSAAQAAQIMEIVRRETDEAPENIKILPRN